MIVYPADGDLHAAALAAVDQTWTARERATLAAIKDGCFTAFRRGAGHIYTAKRLSFFFHYGALGVSIGRVKGGAA